MGSIPIHAWVLTDGKAGDEQPCIGVTEAMGIPADIRRVSPGAPFPWLMPRGPIDPREHPSRPGSPIAPPFPDLLVASGRRAVPYVRFVKRASGGRTFTVILKDPRVGRAAADLIWVAEHDRLRGDNVMVSVTAPHRLSAARLAAARARPDERLRGLPHPRVAVLAGGDSRHHRFTEEDIGTFLSRLEALVASGVSLMITPSRRTPEGLRVGLIEVASRSHGFFWHGEGANPYSDILASAEAVVVTADSSNMMGEAAATGRPILVFHPSGGHPRLDAFEAALSRYAAVHPFTGRLEGGRYEPVDSTPALAQRIAADFSRHRAAIA